MAVNPNYVPPRTTTEVSEDDQRRSVQNSIKGISSYSFPVVDKTLLALVVEVPREWTPQEWVAWLTHQAGGAPVDSQPVIQMLQVATPSEVNDADSCTLYINVHPRLGVKGE